MTLISLHPRTLASSLLELVLLLGSPLRLTANPTQDMYKLQNIKTASRTLH